MHRDPQSADGLRNPLCRAGHLFGRGLRSVHLCGKRARLHARFGHQLLPAERLSGSEASFVSALRPPGTAPDVEGRRHSRAARCPGGASRSGARRSARLRPGCRDADRQSVGILCAAQAWRTHLGSAERQATRRKADALARLARVIRRAIGVIGAGHAAHTDVAGRHGCARPEWIQADALVERAWSGIDGTRAAAAGGTARTDATAASRRRTPAATGRRSARPAAAGPGLRNADCPSIGVVDAFEAG
jgi:hypothetical protein